MPTLILTVTLLLFCTMPISIRAGELVKIQDGTKTATGFLVKTEGKTFLYTTQTAIFGMNLIGVGSTANITTFSNKKITLLGQFEVSHNSDLARFPIQDSSFDTFSIGKVKSQGQKVTIFPQAGTGSATSKQTVSISRIGIYAIKLNDTMKAEAPGSPVLDEQDNAVGVMSCWMWKLYRSGKTYAYTTVNPHVAAKLDVNVQWLPADKAQFPTAANAILTSKRMQKEIVPLLNWWLENPYRLVPSTITYPPELKPFVKYNNKRSPLIRELAQSVKKDLIKNEARMNTIRKSCIDRGRLFINFIHNQKSSLLDIKCKSAYLTKLLIYNAENWRRVEEITDAELKNMKYLFPE